MRFVRWFGSCVVIQLTSASATASLLAQSTQAAELFDLPDWLGSIPGATIRVNAQVLQKATPSVAFGIATAVGRVPQ
jgi:hypothetical protein